MGTGQADKPHLVIPYSLTTNDVKFGRGTFGPGEDFFAYLRDSFDLLYEEGADRPRMMSIGLHMRLTGHPGRAAALIRFIEHIIGHDRVWVCRREDIARHWTNLPGGSFDGMIGFKLRAKPQLWVGWHRRTGSNFRRTLGRAIEVCMMYKTTFAPIIVIVAALLVGVPDAMAQSRVWRIG